MSKENIPISCTMVGEKFWIKRPMVSISTPGQQGVDPPSGHVIYNNLTKVTGEFMVNGSDGSVYHFQKVVLATWVLTIGPDVHMAACFLITDVHSVSSYSPNWREFSGH